MRFAEVNNCSDGEKELGGESGRKKDKAPHPFHLGAPLRPTFAICLFCNKHFHLHTNTQSSRHGIHWVEAGVWFTHWKSFLLFPLDCTMSISTSTERQKNTKQDEVQRKKCAKHPLGERNVKEIKEAKFIPYWVVRISSLENCSILHQFSQHCQIINVTSLCKT